jgi:hypothetical protein
MKNTHVQTFELIEKSFDSNPWFVLFLCVHCCCAYECFASYHTYAFICCVCDSSGRFESERKEELVSIVSLF